MEPTPRPFSHRFVGRDGCALHMDGVALAAQARVLSRYSNGRPIWCSVYATSHEGRHLMIGRRQHAQLPLLPLQQDVLKQKQVFAAAVLKQKEVSEPTYSSSSFVDFLHTYLQ